MSLLETRTAKVLGHAQGWLRSLKTPFRDADGQIVGYVGHGHGITREKRREEALAAVRARLEAQATERAALAEAANRATEAKSELPATRGELRERKLVTD